MYTPSYFSLNIWSPLCMFCFAAFDGHMACWLSSIWSFLQILSLPPMLPNSVSRRLSYMGGLGGLLCLLASRWCGPWGAPEENGGREDRHWRSLFQALSMWSNPGLTAVRDPASAPSAALSLQAPSPHPFRLRVVTLPSVRSTGCCSTLCCFS